MLYLKKVLNKRLKNGTQDDETILYKKELKELGIFIPGNKKKNDLGATLLPSLREGQSRGRRINSYSV